MKLYLSSYKVGNYPEKLSGMIIGSKSIGIIPNALDFSIDSERRTQSIIYEFKELEKLGLSPQILDLKDFFGRENDLTVELEQLNAVWVLGGNTFILRRAMKQSGFDHSIWDMNIEFVYAGYSAGSCVLAPTLKGIHLADDPELIPDKYNSEIIWEGLGIIDFCIAPHYKSNHSESELINKAVEYYIENKVPFIALRDGDVYIKE